MLKHHIVFGELNYILARFALTLLVDDTSERVSLVIKTVAAQDNHCDDIHNIILELATKNELLLTETQLAKLAVYHNDSDMQISEPLLEIEKKLIALGLYHNSLVCWLVDDSAQKGCVSDKRYSAPSYVRLVKLPQSEQYDDVDAAHQAVTAASFGNISGQVGYSQDRLDTALNNYIYRMIDFSCHYSGGHVRAYISEAQYLCFSSYQHYSQALLDENYRDAAGKTLQHQYSLPLKDLVYAIAKALNISVAFIDNPGEELNAQEQKFARILDTSGLITSQGCNSRMVDIAESEKRHAFLTSLEASVDQAARWRRDITADALLFAKEKQFADSFNFASHIIAISKTVNSTKPAVCHAAGALNYGDLEQNIMHCVSHIVRQGITPGTRVALIAHDSPAFVITVLSLLYAGCVAIIINKELKLSTIVQALSTARVGAVFADQDFIHLCQQEQQLPVPVVAALTDICELGTADLAGAEVEKSRWLPARTRPFDEAIGMFTSGTTGVAKLVMHRHQDFVVAAERYAAQVLNINSSDKAFSVSRMSFAFGLHNCFNALFNRATAIISPKELSTNEIVVAIKLYQPTIMYAVPTVYQFLLNHPMLTADDVKAVRCFVSAGDRLPVELNRKWQAKFGVAILDSLGSTEAFSTYITNIPGSSRAFGCTGKLVPGFSARIVNERGVICGPGALGTLWLRGPTLPSKYDNHGAATASRFRDGWYCTNDMFVRDQQGYFSFFGRADDVVKVSGQWVAPQDIEDVLLGHPDVIEVAVLAVGDKETTTRTKAFVVTRRQDHEQLMTELKQYARQHLERWKYPHLFQFVAALPRTVTGKLQREQLKHLVSDHAEWSEPA